jgi:transcriptional regulator with XRE-family HTH domain
MSSPFPDEAGFLASCGAEIRRARLARGLSRDELAERCGLHPNTIGIAERGDRDVSCFAQTRMLLTLGCVQLRLEREGIIPSLSEDPDSPFCVFLRSLPPPLVASRIGDAIRARRGILDLSLEEAAGRAGIHRNTLWNIERGFVAAGSLSLYRVYLSLGVEDLLPSAEDLALR